VTELERELCAHFDRLDIWSVYGDWLQEQGDVRGEILAIEAEIRQHGATSARKGRIEALVDQHYEAWVGPLLLGAMRAERGGELVNIEIEHGFLTGARIALDPDEDGPPAPALLEELLGLSAARFLRRLRLGLFGRPGSNQYGPALELLARSPRHALRELHIGDFSRGDCEISWTEVGELSVLWEALPQLRSLRVHGGGIGMKRLAHERLERLTLETGGLPAEAAQAVATGHTPALTHLEVWFGSPSYGATAQAEDLGALWEGEGYPSLVHLGLRNAAFADELPLLLSEAPLLARLRSLDLSLGTLTRTGAQTLLSRPGPFEHLHFIRLDGNYLDSDTVAALRTAYGRRAEMGWQRTPDGDQLYVSVGE
jgi:uncharacterized protein (TIGR02996 family)